MAIQTNRDTPDLIYHGVSYHYVQANPGLMSVFSFSRVDILTNRDGDLTEEQITRLKEQRTTRIVRGMWIVVTILFIAFTFNILPDNDLIPLSIIILFWIPPVWIMIYLVLYARRTQRELDYQAIDMIVGILDIMPQEHLYRVRGYSDRWVLNKKLLSVLQDEQSYALYVLANTHQILSIEPLQIREVVQLQEQPEQDTPVEPLTWRDQINYWLSRIFYWRMRSK